MSLIALAACSSTPVGSREAQVRSQLNAIGDSYHKCVGTLGENSPQCQALASGIDQVASTVEMGQSTGAAVQMERSMRSQVGR